LNLRKHVTVSQIYHSREDRIKELHNESERVQYDGDDIKRVVDVTETFDHHGEQLWDALEDYAEELASEVDEDSESRMRYARQNVVEKWAFAQAALSKVAWVMRIDGNHAYERLINAIKSDEAIDMRGL
jgi:hypothetical protein